MKISAIRHPDYLRSYEDYVKWRLTFQGGRNFVQNYLVRFSKREDENEFKERRAMAHSPSFAKAGINKLKNTFYSRMSEIVRIGGPKSYISACNGEKGGVDLYGSAMNRFMGEKVLPELMTMRTVGVYVDKPPLDGKLLSKNNDKKPYLYIYKAEDILSWNWSYYDGEFVYYNILLRDTDYTYDQTTGLVGGTRERFRHMWIGEDGYVHIQFWTANDEDDENDIKDGPEITLPLKRLPFVVLGLKESLLADVADYQIGLLNLASSDLNYVKNANFPFYTEQFDPVAAQVYNRRPPLPNIARNASVDPAEGTYVDSQRADRDDEVIVGTLKGRKYPKGVDRPDFIAPPTEPLLASMKKQEQMKADIFELIDVAASNAQPQHASAESKQMDDRGIESGLSYIGLELEWGEREIAKIWAGYESEEPAEVKYPPKYTLKSDEQRLNEAEKLNDIKTSAPSRTFAKEVGKQIVDVMLSDKVANKTLETIKQEIDEAEYISSDPDLIKTASELGMVDAVTGSNALGFNGDKVVPKAQEEHAKRLALIAESQAKGAARGNPDEAPVQGKDADAKREKDNSQKNKDKQSNPAQDKTRGAE
jgi:hypothetical protein